MSRRGRRHGFCGTPWSRSSSPSYPFRWSTFMCRRWWTKLRKSSGSSSHCLLLPSRLSKCPRSFLRTPSRSERRSGLRSWRNSWWKCRRTPVMLFLSWPCKPWGGGKHGLCLSSFSPPGQGGIQILAAAMVAEAVVDVSVTTQLQFQQSFVGYVEVPQLQFIDREVGVSVASQRQGSQCKLCRRPEIARCILGLVGTRPSLCNDRHRWSRQFSLEVPKVQFPRFWTSL